MSNKLFHVHFKYRSDGDLHFVSRAVSAVDGPTASVKLLENVRTRAGYCKPCGRSCENINAKDAPHGHVLDKEGKHSKPGCNGLFKSEADAELHGNVRVHLIGDEVGPSDPIKLEINGQTFEYAQPGNKDNKWVLR